MKKKILSARYHVMVSLNADICALELVTIVNKVAYTFLANLRAMENVYLVGILSTLYVLQMKKI